MRQEVERVTREELVKRIRVQMPEILDDVGGKTIQRGQTCGDVFAVAGREIDAIIKSIEQRGEQQS